MKDALVFARLARAVVDAMADDGLGLGSGVWSRAIRGTLRRRFDWGSLDDPLDHALTSSNARSRNPEGQRL